MATFYRSSKIWVLDFTYDGRPRRWFKALAEGADAPQQLTALLHDWYAERGKLVTIRPATAEEELQYVRGTLPRNMLCPTGRGPRSEPKPPRG